MYIIVYRLNNLVILRSYKFEVKKFRGELQINNYNINLKQIYSRGINFLYAVGFVCERENKRAIMLSISSHPISPYCNAVIANIDLFHCLFIVSLGPPICRTA